MRNTLFILIGLFMLFSAPLFAQTSDSSKDQLKIISPVDGSTIDSALTVILEWAYPIREQAPYGPYFDFPRVDLIVSKALDGSNPILSVQLSDSQNTYRLAVEPGTTYYWQITPYDENGLRPGCAAKASFTTGTPRIDVNAGDEIRYANPRPGAHWRHEKPVLANELETLSPWYEKKAYLDGPVPSFDSIKEKLPVPVYEGHPDVLDAYWYCWKTLLHNWYFSPDSPDHQAVGNICGIRSWGPWGSTMVFDTAFILHFARYGDQAYPFITGFDNCYARQHENGYICRESDKNNHEVYVVFPVNPPLFAWAEWEYYKVNGDRNRLAKVFLPIVKHYEWFMTYQRRENGLYWTNGAQEADDSPRNGIVHYAVSATSYQALCARYLARIAATIGRNDLVPFFEHEHTELGRLVNENFWDEKHGIYNDLNKEGRFITELTPGSFCKHIHMFWPLLAGIAPKDRAERVVAELKNPESFNRRNGVPSLSADSAGYTGGPQGSGQYWRGAVWPSGQSMVQEGLRESGFSEYADEISEKYFKAQVEAFLKEGTIKENLAPDQAAGFGVAEFVGWGGIGPVANLIESVLGFDINTPEKTVTWRITKTEEHGIRNLRIGNAFADLICKKRSSAEEPCVLEVQSTGNFQLVIIQGDKTKSVAIESGTRQINSLP
jgi:hypothetical protein